MLTLSEMSDTFKTITAPAEGIYKEKMSKFLAFAIPVTSAEEAKSHIVAYQKEYYDARHVCWAYMLGAARTNFQSNDNGEPSGTAGKPILGQINSFGLTNVLIIVVRYFGGRDNRVPRDRRHLIHFSLSRYERCDAPMQIV